MRDLLSGPGGWVAILAAGLAAGLYLDRGGSGTDRWHGTARLTGLLALFVVSAVAVGLAWEPPISPTRRLREAAAWWAPSLVLLWLGAFSARVGGTNAMSRLAAAQAVPAILLQLAPALGWRAGGALLAGAARLGVPPLHPLHLAAADTLPFGTLLVLLVASFVLGTPPAIAGALQLSGGVGVVAALLALATGAIGAAALRDASLSRRLAIWASVQASLSLLATWAAASTGVPSPSLGLEHAAACAALLPLLGIAVGGVLRRLHTDDLRAFGGMMTEAPRRAVALLVVAFAAPAVSGRAAGLLGAVGLASTSEWMPRAACVAALVGWVGSNLALVLAAYRAVRGTRPSPGDPVGEPRLVEWSLHALAAAFCVWALWAGDFGVEPFGWRAGAAIP